MDNGFRTRGIKQKFTRNIWRKTRRPPWASPLWVYPVINVVQQTSVLVVISSKTILARSILSQQVAYISISELSTYTDDPWTPILMAKEWTNWPHERAFTPSLSIWGNTLHARIWLLRELLLVIMAVQVSTFLWGILSNSAWGSLIETLLKEDFKKWLGQNDSSIGCSEESFWPLME